MLFNKLNRASQRYSLLIIALILSCSNTEPVSVGKTVELNIENPNIVVIGDFGVNNSDQKKVAKNIENYCSLAVCDLGITVGDNFYPSGVKSVTDSKWKTHFEDIYPFNIVFYPSFGNHDYAGNTKAQLDYKSAHWSFPSSFYKIKFPKFSILAIDSNRFSGDQLTWLEEQLKLGDVLFVYGHHPIYSYGEHGDTGHMKTRLLPLLKKYSTKVYISGHDHDKQVIVKNGVTQIVQGASGKLRPTKSGEGTRYSASTLGFGIVNKDTFMFFGDEDLLPDYSHKF